MYDFAIKLSNNLVSGKACDGLCIVWQSAIWPDCKCCNSKGGLPLAAQGLLVLQPFWFIQGNVYFGQHPVAQHTPQCGCSVTPQLKAYCTDAADGSPARSAAHVPPPKGAAHVSPNSAACVQASLCCAGHRSPLRRSATLATAIICINLQWLTSTLRKCICKSNTHTRKKPSHTGARVRVRARLPRTPMHAHPRTNMRRALL